MTETIHISFTSEEAAEKALAECGFSLGTTQRDDPRGIMHGDYLIMKWRNLSKQDRADLHGVYERHGRGGPVTLSMRQGCPAKPLHLLAELSAP